jgi:hypothetical protein
MNNIKKTKDAKNKENTQIKTYLIKDENIKKFTEYLKKQKQ